MIHLVFCSKDEKPYIKDFFDWYYNLGFEVMHCADNGWNGTKLDGINYYDYTQASAFQIPYYQLITNWLDKGDWAFFCDVDEMLTIDVGSIDKFVALVPNDVDCVLFNWKCYR